jgi:uncharacterized protein with PIN domain
MSEVYFRFYASLNYFLTPNRRQVRFIRHFSENPSIKDGIEALGVPHPEVDLILVNGQAVDFSYLIQDRDWISVYPAFTCLDITPLSRLRPPLPEIRFILDIHLGKLANYLRLLGFDTLYRNDYRDEELAEISSQEARILLTRDRGLLKRRLVTYGYCVRQDKAKEQVIEILQRFALFPQIRPFQRCLRCNGWLQLVDKATIKSRLLPKTRQYYDEFCLCQKCGQIYWQGSHYQPLQALIKTIFSNISGASLVTNPKSKKV